MKLLLFDIDGTLLRVSKTGRRLVEDVLSDVIGRRAITDGVRFSGRTDFPIIRDVMLASGIAADEAERMLPDMVASYEARALDLLVKGQVDLLPGVAELLDVLSRRSDTVLGLLTGNIESLAYAKLRACGVVDHFGFGAFGSDRENRYELPPIAVARAAELTGFRFEGKNVVIIGDTEHDVLCGRSIGVFSVAVATGRFDRDFLQSHEPDLLLDDLTRPELLVESIF